MNLWLCTLALAGGTLWGDVRCSDTQVLFNGQPAPPASSAVAGLRVIAVENGPQAAVAERSGEWVVALEAGETAEVCLAAEELPPKSAFAGRVECREGQGGEIRVACDGVEVFRAAPSVSQWFEFPVEGGARRSLSFRVTAVEGPLVVRWSQLGWQGDHQTLALPLTVAAVDSRACPPPELPALRPGIEQALVEWDWRMQDGIGTPRAADSYSEAIAAQLRRGSLLLDHVRAQGAAIDDAAAQWNALSQRWEGAWIVASSPA